MDSLNFDVFISYASEDRFTAAIPIADQLRKQGYRVWIDAWELHCGDPLRNKINDGLSKSRYGVVILSKAFFRKSWPQEELDALMGKESIDKTVVLPVRHGISHEEVKQYHPTLANKLSTTTEKGIESVVAEIVSVLVAPSFNLAAESFKGAKLYDARHERVLRKGYQIKYVSVSEPGQKVKYVPVYRAPSGDEVFEDEAMVDGIAIVEIHDTIPSKSERERAIEKLCSILIDKQTHYVDYKMLKIAIEAMALESDLKFQVGEKIADNLPPENPDADYAVKFLADSALKEAISPLTNLLVYEASWDHVTCCEDSVHDLARTTLRKFIADDPDLYYEAAKVALALFERLDNKYYKYYKDIMKTWAEELLKWLVNSASKYSDWANDQLRNLNGG